MNILIQRDCCNKLFDDFMFQDLKSALPPKKKGVYAIRVKQAGVSVKEIYEKLYQLLQKLNWKMIEEKVLSRINRLEKINQCSIIYIGSAGTHKGSKNTLKGRYKEFAGRHTAMYPIWALVYFGWKLEFGWKETENPSQLEDQLKQKYKKLHNDKLPALVER